jgi:uncharacterized membrane protein
MAFCGKCGAQVPTHAKFCASCGSPFGTFQRTSAPGDITPEQAVLYTDSIRDMQENKVFGILSYIGPLVLVSILAAPKKSRYARFHSSQGFLLLMLEAVILFVIGGINMFTYYSGIPLWRYSFNPVIYLVKWSAGILIAALAVIGIVNASKGEQRKLPIIGDLFQILK